MIDNPTWRRLRGRVAGLSRDRSPDDPELVEARSLLKLTRLQAYIEKAVTEPPALTSRQRDDLALLLLRGHGTDRG